MMERKISATQYTVHQNAKAAGAVSPQAPPEDAETSKLVSTAIITLKDLDLVMDDGGPRCSFTRRPYS